MPTYLPLQVNDSLDLGELYCGLPSPGPRYALRSMVCYYGSHYQALVLVPDLGCWLLLDDAAVSSVGDWGDVVRKCEAGRIQPCALFFELQSSASGGPQ